MHTKYSFNPLLTESIIAPIIGAPIGLYIGAFIAGKFNSHELYHYILSEIEKDPSNKVKFVKEAIAHLTKNLNELKRRDAFDSETDGEIDTYGNSFNYGVQIEYLQKRINSIKSALALDNEDYAKVMVKNFEFCKTLNDKYYDIGKNHRVRNLSLAGGGLAAGALAYKGVPYAKALAKRIHL